MDNAIREPQTILLLGGTSDIGRAIVREFDSPVLQRVVLACRRPDDVDTTGLSEHAEVTAVRFDATDHEAHEDLISSIADDAGDLDVVIQAFGQLGGTDLHDPVGAAALAQVNYVGAVSSGLAVAQQLRTQGHGTLVVLSSVAGVRTRASNFVYGSSKAGQVAFATGLGDWLHGSGAHVMTVRPGFVRSSMTAGMEEAPFSVDTADVAEAVANGLRRGSSVVWVPGILRVVFGLLLHAPRMVWRKLDR